MKYILPFLAIFAIGCSEDSATGAEATSDPTRCSNPAFQCSGYQCNDYEYIQGKSYCVEAKRCSGKVCLNGLKCSRTHMDD